MSKAAICYLTWNRFTYTKLSLESILDKTNRSDYELILWDNGSTEPGMLDWLRDCCKENNFKYLFFKNNQGLTRAMNNQMKIMNKSGNYDVFCHIANDIVVCDNWLNGIFEAISIKKVGAVGLNLERQPFEKVIIDGVELEKIRQEGNIGGMHYCIPKWMYDLLGGFKHVQFNYGQQDANHSLQIKLLPMDVWIYYLPLDKYKGKHLPDEDNEYQEYQNKINHRLKLSGSDKNAGRNYREILKSYRHQYDKKLITAEQLIEKLKDNDKFLLVDKSQLLETNIMDFIE